MSNFISKSELELDMFLKSEPSLDISMKDKILEMLELFSSQGHSGMSAGLVLNLFKTASIEQLVEAGAFDEEEDFYGGMTGNATEALINLFKSQDYGNLQNRTLARDIFITLANHEPLGPITCSDEEWGDVKDYGGGPYYQNRRLSSVFKEGEDGKPYYINAIVWKDQKGHTWTGSALTKDGEKIGSGQYINLPFEPRTFYVDIIAVEYHKNKETGEIIEQAGGDWWENFIKDESQLDEVFEYFEKKSA